jgi:hypothetical protein
MSTFLTTLSPTPFGFFDSDSQFQSEADSMVTFVKRKLGDDVLSVELTKKQIWACFEESLLEYGSIVNQYQARSQLSSILGSATGSLTGGEQKLPKETLEYALRLAEPYSSHAGLGGSYNTLSGSIELKAGKQDYDIYEELKGASGDLIISSSMNPGGGKMRIFEVFHFSPQAAYRFFDTTSAINYLNNEFSFESFTPETVFYVLPVFEDVLRGGQMSISNKVRRSNFSWQITGTKIRIYPTPSVSTHPLFNRLFIRVGFSLDPYNPSMHDPSINGVSNMSNAPFGNIPYSQINSIGRQWVREYTLALCKELLGLIRSKFSTVPIPGGELTLNGSDLVSSGKEDKDRLTTQLKEMLDTLTYDKLVEMQASKSDNLQKILRAIPVPAGKAIIIG